MIVIVQRYRRQRIRATPRRSRVTNHPASTVASLRVSVTSRPMPRAPPRRPALAPQCRRLKISVRMNGVHGPHRRATDRHPDSVEAPNRPADEAGWVRSVRSGDGPCGSAAGDAVPTARAGRGVVFRRGSAGPRPAHAGAPAGHPDVAAGHRLVHRPTRRRAVAGAPAEDCGRQREDLRLGAATGVAPPRLSRPRHPRGGHRLSPRPRCAGVGQRGLRRADAAWVSRIAAGPLVGCTAGVRGGAGAVAW